MSSALILGMLALFIVAAIGLPVAYSIIVGVLVYLSTGGQDLAIAGEMMVQRLFDGFLLLAVPLFIVSANIMNAGAISDRLLKFCIALVGRFRGGMGHVNVVASLIFSGMSGSAVADAAGVGKLIIDMMVKSGKYTRGYAAAITAATATIGPIIPPSIPMVMYALVSNASIGYLFLAGVVPGLMMGAVLMAMNTFISHRRDFGKEDPVPMRKLPGITIQATPALLMPVILLTAIYSGVTTPTEAAGCGSMGALLLSLAYKKLTLPKLQEALVKTLEITALIMVLVAASNFFGAVFARLGTPTLLTEFLLGLEMNKYLILAMIMAMIFLLGWPLEWVPIVMIIIPIILPLVEALGFNLTWFAILVAVNLQTCWLSPPVALSAYFLKGVVPEWDLKDIYLGMMQFMVLQLIGLILIVIFPQIALWLPTLLYGN